MYMYINIYIYIKIKIKIYIYIYIKIYTYIHANIPGNAIARLPHPRNGSRVFKPLSILIAMRPWD